MRNVRFETFYFATPFADMMGKIFTAYGVAICTYADPCLLQLWILIRLETL
jgi:hypothetical protein